MRQVRLALGPDALIVSNRRVNGGVEILATDPTSLSEAESEALARPVHGAPAAPEAPAAPAGPASSAPTAPAVSAARAAPSRNEPASRSPMSPMGAYAAAFQAA